MKIQSKILTGLLKIFLMVASTISLLACEPVSVGTWQISMEIENANQNSMWTITSEPTLIISTNSELQVDEIELAGSRINWSTDAGNLPSLGLSDRISFNGTVNGSELAGTLFTQQGNYTVTGIRQTNNSL